MRFRRALWTLGSSYASFILLSVLTLLLTPVVVESIGLEGYGLWSLILAFAGYLALLDFGLGTAVVQHVAHERVGRETGSALSSVLVLYLVAAIAALGIGIAIGFQAPAVLHTSSENVPYLTWGIVLTSARVAVTLSFNVFSGLIRGTQRGYLVDATVIVGNALSFAMSIAALRTGWGLFGVLVPPVLVTIVQGPVLVMLSRRVAPEIRIRPAVTLAASSAGLLRFSSLLFLNLIASNVVFSTDVIVAGVFVGVTAAAVYQLAARAGQLLLAIVFRVADAALPGLTEIHGHAQLERVAQVHLEVLKLTTVVSVPTAVLYAVYNADFVRLWVRTDISDQLPLTVALAYLIIHHSILHVSALALIGSGRVAGMAFMSIVEAAANLALSIFLATRMGLFGIVLGTIAAGLATSGWYTPLMASRSLRIPITRYVATGIVPGMIAVIPFAFLAVAARSARQPDSLPELAVITAGLLGLYLFASWRWTFSALERHRYAGRLAALRQRTG